MCLVRPHIKARVEEKTSEKFKEENNLGEENTGLGVLHVVMREKEASLMLPVVGHFVSCQSEQNRQA